MLEEFKKHIQEKFSILKQQPFILACSGGIDSVVLAHLCAKSDLKFSIAHCNFKLRGEASDADEIFVRDLATVLGVPFFSTQFNTQKYIEKHKISIQIGARTLRYSWFLNLLETHHFGCIVTAHQADDALETFLINLSRGTGIDGLIGIPEHTETLVRPLLVFSRAEINAYATLENIEWREDQSNAETKYIRNKIRHQITPILKELHPTFLENFKKTQDFIRQTAVISDNKIQELKEKIFIKEAHFIRIDTAKLTSLSPLKGYVYGLFKAYGFTAWQDIESLLTAMSGKEIFSKTHRLLKDRNYILLQKIREEDANTYVIKAEDIYIEKPIKLKLETISDLEESTKNVLYVAKETLKFPLTVRKWKEGDYFYPFGMQGKKRIAKFFKDEKMNAISKEKQWLLCSGDAIIWVIGRRADNRFRVTKDTQQILKVIADI